MANYTVCNATRRLEENDPWRAESRHQGHSNVQCYVFNARGALVRGFDAFPAQADDGMRGRGQGRGPQMDFDRMPAYLCGEIAQASIQLGVNASSVPARSAKLPDVEGKGPLTGIRIFTIPSGGAVPQESKSAMVDAVTVEAAERALLSPVRDREIDAEGLRRWLEPAFPPGLMEQKTCRFERIEGKLSLRVVGSGQAFLRGRIQLIMDDEGSTPVDGMLEAVITFDRTSNEVRTLRGVFKGEYGRWDPMHRNTRGASLSVTLESRPDPPEK